MLSHSLRPHGALALAWIFVVGCEKAPETGDKTAEVHAVPDTQATAATVAAPSAAPVEAVAAPAPSAAASDPKVDDAAGKAAATTVAPPTAAATPTTAGTSVAALAGTASAPAVASAAPEAPPAPAEAAPVESPKVAEAAFSTWLTSPGKLKVGQQATIQAVVVPKGEFHCNENYPYKVKLDAPPAGLSFPSPVVRKEGLAYSATRSSLSVPVVATAPGPQRVSGTFYFSVCNASQCVIENRSLAVNIEVEP